MTAMLNRAKKPRMLVVDDEPDNLDLLYRTFRREFQVLRADCGAAALKLLSSEGEVAVIISDQRMPEMKGTEFLSKTVPQFPDTVRIILTGFTDVEDLVDAINAGQVYRYITKPWDPEELKGVVQRAAETYDLLKQRSEDLLRAQVQATLMMAIGEVADRSGSVAEALDQLASAFLTALGAQGCVVAQVVEGEISPTQGTAGDAKADALGDDALIKQAIADQSVQRTSDAASDANLSGGALYDQVQAHLVAPITYRGKPTAVISIQWAEPTPIAEHTVALMHLLNHQVALVLECLKNA